MLTTKEILKTAQKIRSEFEQHKISKQTLRELYSVYNPHVDIDDFIDEAENMFPVLNCGIATVHLKHIIGSGDIIQGSYQGNNHTFLLLENKIVVDITADQYDGPAVYVGNIILPWSKSPVLAKI